MNLGSVMGKTIFYGSIFELTLIIRGSIQQSNIKQIMLIRRFLKPSNWFSHIYSFARVRRSHSRTSRYEEVQQQRFSTPKVKEFDYFPEIEDVTNYDQTQVQQEQLSQSYNQADEHALDTLRKQQEQILVKISQGKDQYKEYRSLLSSKMGIQLRFRNWEQMLIDCDNCIQSLKYEKDRLPQAQQLAIEFYHKKCAIYIVNDHDRLYQLLTMTSKQTAQKATQSRKKSHMKENVKEFGFQLYEFANQGLTNKVGTKIQAETLSEIVIMKAIGFFVLGKRNEAIKTLAILLNNKAGKKLIIEKAWISLITGLTFPSQTLEPFEYSFVNQLKQFKEINQEQIKALQLGYLKPQHSEQLARSLLKEFNGIEPYQVTTRHLQVYGKLFFMICQNYYLEKQQNKFKPLFSLLSSNSSPVLSFMLSYLKLGILVDRLQYKQALQLFQKIQDYDEENSKDGRFFYDPSSISCDSLRVNMLKMAAAVYQQLKDDEQAQECMSQAQILECNLGLYTLKQPSDMSQQIWQDDWRKRVQVRVPYYYFNLQLHKLFVQKQKGQS